VREDDHRHVNAGRGSGDPQLQVVAAAGPGQDHGLDGDGLVPFVDGSEQRRDVARALGADVHSEIVPDRDCWKYPVVIGVARETEMLAEAVRCLAPGAHLSNAAMFFADTPLPLWEMNKRDVTFSSGTASVKPHVPAVLELIRSGQSTPTGSGRRTTGRPPRRPCSNPTSSP